MRPPPLLPHLCGDCHTGWHAPAGARRCPECGGDNFTRPVAPPGPRLLPPPGWQPPPPEAPSAFGQGFGLAFGLLTGLALFGLGLVTLAFFACCGGAALLR